VDDSLEEDFLQGYVAADSREDEIFTPPSSSSEILCVNDWPKLLQEFLVENFACSIVGVPHLETSIRAKRMLELHHKIVQ
jgi:hypothetical protein